MSWFVRNIRDMKWYERSGRGFVTEFLDGDDQVDVNLFVLGPGESMSMYHWEADQEGFLVLAGEALLIVEDEEIRCGNGTTSTARRRFRIRSSAPGRGRPRSSLSEHGSTSAATAGAAIRIRTSR